jgi:hypothetical protein
MTLMLLSDPDKGSSAEQEIPDHGVVTPCAIDDTPLTKKEWEALIKKGLPLLIKDVKAAPKAEEEES